MAWSGGVPWPGAVGRGVAGVGRRGRQLRRRSAVAGRAGAGFGPALGLVVRSSSWEPCSGRHSAAQAGSPARRRRPARKRSTAVWPTSSTSSSCWTFGTLTMSWLSPEVVTSLSPTPRESTRAWMMLCASCKLFGIDLAGTAGVLGGQRDGGAAPQVKTEIRRPVVGQRHQAEQRGHDHAEHDQGAARMAALCCQLRSFPGRGRSVRRRLVAGRPAASRVIEVGPLGRMHCVQSSRARWSVTGAAGRVGSVSGASGVPSTTGSGSSGSSTASRGSLYSSPGVTTRAMACLRTVISTPGATSRMACLLPTQLRCRTARCRAAPGCPE